AIPIEASSKIDWNRVSPLASRAVCSARSSITGVVAPSKRKLTPGQRLAAENWPVTQRYLAGRERKRAHWLACGQVMQPTIVMKFGGTSVADAQRLKRAAQRIVDKREAGNRVVAVLSARGKETDRLIADAH